MNLRYESDDVTNIKLAKESLPNEEDINALADFYKIMGDNTRLRLLMALQQKDFCVSDLCNIVDMSRSAVSHQLKELKNAKLVRSKKIGKVVYYALDDQHIHEVLAVALEHIQE